MQHRLTPATRMGLSISIATGLYGISFGALSVAAGFSLPQTLALSLLMFTGGSQFAYVAVAAGGGGFSAFAAASLLGLRNALYAVQLKAWLRLRGRKIPLAAQLTIDESTATSLGQERPDERRRGFWVAGIGVYVLWNLFTLLGALLGDALGDPRRWGLDGAAVAAFVALLWPRLAAGQAQAVAVLAALTTLLALPWLPAGLPILLAAAVAAVLGAWQYQRQRRRLTERDAD